MMGTSHAITGTLAFVGSTLIVGIGSPLDVVIGAALATGGALLPDIDHHSSTVTRTYGPVTRVLSWVLKKASGGHRRGTHSLAGIGLLWGFLYFAETQRETLWAQIVLISAMSLAMSAAIRLLHIPGWLDDVAPIPVNIVLVSVLEVDLRIVPLALAMGCVAHVAGDMMTKTGCPVLWPLTSSKYKLRLFTTGAWPERWLVVPLSLLTIVAVLGYHAAGAIGMVK